MEQDPTNNHEYLQRVANEFGIDINTIEMPEIIMNQFYRVNPSLRPVERGTTAAAPIVIIDSSDEEEDDEYFTAPGSLLKTTPINPAPVNPAPARQYISQEDQIRLCYDIRMRRLLQHRQNQQQ